MDHEHEPLQTGSMCVQKACPTLQDWGKPRELEHLRALPLGNKEEALSTYLALRDQDRQMILQILFVNSLTLSGFHSLLLLFLFWKFETLLSPLLCTSHN